jgi:excinuclease ABC subunit B
MHAGDHSRKSTLVEYGWRLPSAIHNRPLKFSEFTKRIQKTVYVSATPGKYELEKAGKKSIVEQVVRPTGLLDPTIEIHPTQGQIPHLLEQIKARAKKKERVIVTTLTKRMAEDLAEHLAEKNIKANYLHSEIKTLERVKILKDFRLGRYDVLIGVNLLREGLDLPEVSLVAILDADKEGFLRNTTTMIQTMGRAARHINGHVVLYADKDTKSIKAAVSETSRRRDKQDEHNKKMGITPTSIKKAISSFDMSTKSNAQPTYESSDNIEIPTVVGQGKAYRLINQLTKIMEKAIRKMDYDRALSLREKIQRLKQVK